MQTPEAEQDQEENPKEEEQPIEPPDDFLELSWQELWDIVVQLPAGEMRDGLAHRAAVLQAEAGDPSAAIITAEEHLPAGPVCDTTVRAVIFLWASTDTNAPTTWARSLPEGHRREHALFSLVLSLVDKHQQEAANVASDLPPGGDARRNAVSLVAFRWGRVNAGLATAWAQGLSDREERELALSKIAQARR